MGWAAEVAQSCISRPMSTEGFMELGWDPPVRMGPPAPPRPNSPRTVDHSVNISRRCAPCWAAFPARRIDLENAAAKVDPLADQLYRYLNFDQIDGFEDAGRVVSVEEEAKVLAEV